jgi:hypothetical protein
VSGPVDTIQETRRANLLLLLNEVAQDIGTERGAAAELARRTGVPGPQISQTIGRKLHQGGKERLLGDESARKLERGMNKPKGWMDVAHHGVMSERDAETLNAIGALTPDQRSLIEAQIYEYARLNRGLGDAPQSAHGLQEKPH